MHKKDWLVFLGTAILVALFPLIAARFAAIGHYVDIMVFAGIFSIANLGLCMLMGYAGQVSMAQAAFFGIGAYTSGILTSHYHWSPLPAIPVGCALSALVAWIVGIPALRLKGHYLAMATLGFGVIVHIVLNQEVAWTGGPSGMVDIPAFRVLGKKITSETAWYYIVWTSVFITLLFCFNVLHSRVGRALRALHEEETAADAMGAPTARLKIQVFIMSAVLAALAGSFYTYYVTFLNPGSFDLMWSIRFVLMVMLGGMQSLWGAILGTVLLTFIGNEWLHAFADFDILIYGAILLLVALFLPQGLVSLFSHGRKASGNA